MTDFLAARPDRRTWEIPEGGRAAFEAAGSFIGPGNPPFEVAVARCVSKPNVSDVRTLWKRRKGATPSPLLLVILYGEHVALCGPVGEDPAPVMDLEVKQVERLATAALDAPDRLIATALVRDALQQLETDLPGLRNEGMFATHELRKGVRARSDWEVMREWGAKILGQRGKELVTALGFTIEQLATNISVLRVKDQGTRVAVAVLLDESEQIDAASARFNGSSPVSAALAKADDENLGYVVLVRGSQIRVHAATKHTGVGRRGRADTFVEANLSLLPDSGAGYLPLIFGAEALRPGGSFQEILSQSMDYGTGLGERLRDRVYVDVVPKLAQAVASRHKGKASEADLADLYETALVILFRLLFVAYAEDRELLPLRDNGLYRRNALKTLARDIADQLNEEPTADYDPNATDRWDRVMSLWKAVHDGHTEWGVPPYNGGMFSADPSVSPVGARIADLELTNAEFGPALSRLLVDYSDDESVYAPVDFRSLSVREFGTIYEGLLESSLSVAPSNLALSKDRTYITAKQGDDVEVEAGDIYLHSQSGARKATGSYFTKAFVVEHLLDQALELALDDHLTRLRKLIDAGEDHDAADAFFDFRVADIAMGSGHFLVAAVDHVEARLASFLAEHPVPGVIAELERLRATALKNLGDYSVGVEIEYSTLLRRQVARHCIYGVDLNLIAVELARLAIWIHTFVPGLPLSFLDHNLVQGNSLTGIGTMGRVVDGLVPRGAPARDRRVILGRLTETLERATPALEKLARLNDASASEVKEARLAHAEGQQAVAGAAAMFDYAVARYLDRVPATVRFDIDFFAGEADTAAAAVRDLDPLHFPVSFPEVFLRPQAGFDCVIGNPPWDKVRHESQHFWVTRDPGLNSLAATARQSRIEDLRSEHPIDAAIEDREIQERETLQTYFSSAYVTQGRGHHDFAKLFLERALEVGGVNGALGYVLPRQTLVLGGWSKLREVLLERSSLKLFQARNRAGWLFEDVDHRFMMVLLARTRADVGSAEIWGAAKGLPDLRDPGESLVLPLDEIEALSETHVLPWLNDVAAVEVFRSLANGSSLSAPSGWVVGVAEDRWDFSGTGRHHDLVIEQEESGSWRILMARHVGHFALDLSKPFQRFIRNPNELLEFPDIEQGDDRVRLSANHQAIVYRYPSINDNARTLIPALLPEEGFLPSKGYVHGIKLKPPVELPHLLALLGYLGSFTCDWWVRRFVDRHVTAPVVGNIRLPSWDDKRLEEVAGIVAAVLRAVGISQLPAGVDLSPFPERSDGLDVLLSELEMLVLAGFGLGKSHLLRILDDFSKTGCSDDLRLRMIETAEEKLR